MLKRIFFRALAAVMAALMLLQICGCNSVIAQTVVVMREETEEGGDDDWSFDTYTTKVINEYPSGGTNAFYFNSAKCQEDSIEEFHVLNFFDDKLFLYYYTAPTAPSYKGEDRNTAYYCLATHNITDGTYTEILSGFYDKNNSVSMAYHTTTWGVTCVCIGDTFLFFASWGENRAVFNLNDKMKQYIKDKVSDQYLCIDIAIIDSNNRLITAAFMDVSDIEEEDGEQKTALFEIQFDPSTDKDHSIRLIENNLESSYGNVCSSYTDGVSFYDSYYLTKIGSNYCDFKVYAPYFPVIGKETQRFYTNNRNDELRSFSVTSDYDRERIMITTLYDDYLIVCMRTDANIDGGVKHIYSNVSRFQLDESRTYIAMDDMPSVILVEHDMIFTCSLTNGFRQVGAIGSKVRSYTIKSGAYYAAYQPISAYYLLGFDTTTHKASTVTYRNGKEVSRQISYVPYTMADLPYAKVYRSTKTTYSHYPLV